MKQKENNVRRSKGFTLLETLVAVSLLSIAIVAPISLAGQSLTSALYARDQVIASNLAQEAIEGIRSIRDDNILRVNLGDTVDLLDGIPLEALTNGTPFTVDTVNGNAATLCSGTPPLCPLLETNGQFYGYRPGGATACLSGVPPGTGDCWAPTLFRRSVTAQFIDAAQDELRITVTITWTTGRIQQRIFTIAENLYRWTDDGSGG